jgi:hypothetical protein
MREEQLSEHRSLSPSGAAFIVDKRAMDGLLDRLQNGEPTKGWAGDKRLALAFHKPSQRWELWRAESGSYSLVGRSPVGAGFPADLIDQLVAHDVQRGFDPFQHVQDHNDAIEAQKQKDLSEAMGPVYQKLYWALRRDDRTGAGL